MSKPVSQKQLAANRRNAKKSTGPRTPAGRAVSRLNALKHGILSREVLVNGHHIQESAEELQALHQRFCDDLQPKGPLEELLVDQIVTAHWRLRRALIGESGEIARSVDDAHRRQHHVTDPVLQWIKWSTLGDPVHAMEKSVAGNTILLAWLREVRAAVESGGALTESVVQSLASRFGGKPNSLVLALDDLRKQQEAEAGGDADTRREQQKAAAIAFLDRKINTCTFFLERCEEDDFHSGEARRAAAVLPSGDTLDRILRYETKLERQMYRAMAQLERLQRMRRGEEIPAPVSVEVSARV